MNHAAVSSQRPVSIDWHYLALTTDGLVLTSSDRGKRTVCGTAEAVSGMGLRAEFDGPVLRPVDPKAPSG
jgi:hypothetical protein